MRYFPPRGKYKKKENKVIMINDVGESVGILFDTTPAYLTPSAMQELVEWITDALAKATHHPRDIFCYASENWQRLTNVVGTYYHLIYNFD